MQAGTPGTGPRARCGHRWPTTTSGPRCRTPPTSWVTRWGSPARRPPRTRGSSSSAAWTSWPRRRPSSLPTARSSSPSRGPGAPWRPWSTRDGLAALKAEHPEAVVVSYVNTSAAVKALSDICCTSANAPEVVASIPPTARSSSRPTATWELGGGEDRPDDDPVARATAPRTTSSSPRTSWPPGSASRGQGGGPPRVPSRRHRPGRRGGEHVGHDPVLPRGRCARSTSSGPRRA